MNDVQSYLSRGKEAEQKKQWPEAAELYKQVLALAPDHKIAIEQLAWCYSCNKQHYLAIEVLEGLKEREPEIAKWPYMLGYQYQELQRHDKAIEWYDRALVLKRDYIVVLYRKGYTHAQQIAAHAKSEKQAQAKESIGKALQSFTRCRELWNALPEGSTKQRDRGNYIKAVYHQAKVLVDYAEHRALRGSDAIEAAVTLLCEATLLDPVDHNKYYLLGKAYLAQGEYEKALVALQEADRLDPNQDYVLDKLAEALLRLSRLQESLAVYLRIPPRLRKDYILRNMGRLYHISKEYGKASETLQLAVQKNQRNHNGHYYLGLCYRDTHQFSLALRELKEAIRLRQKFYNKPFPEAQQAIDELLAQHPEVTNELVKSGRQRGTVAKYNNDRKFGYIRREAGGELFFHITDCLDGEQYITVGNRVEFEEKETVKGPRAVRVQGISS
jgi:tetratricopeptide (TPR) repeat protein